MTLLILGLIPATSLGKPGRPGAPDPSFGPGSLNFGIIPSDSFANGLDNYGGLGLTPGGRIILAGDTAAAGINDFALGRLRGNGVVDTSFGDPLNHVSVGDIFGDDEIGAIAVGPGGSTFIATDSESGAVHRIGVAKVDASGSFDNGFDGDGRTTTTIGNDALARAVAVQKDGKVVVAGSGDVGGSTDLAVVRYLPSGLPDPAFGGGDGIATSHIGSSTLAFDVAIQKDGKIVVAGGRSLGASTDSEAIVARFRANGTLDPSFGSGGKAHLDVGKISFAFGLAVGSRGKVVLAGVGGSGGSSLSGFVARLTRAGKRDHGFGGGDGVTRSKLRQGFAYVTDVALQRNGKIVVAGFGGDVPGVIGGTLLGRFTADGRVDKGFADRGSRLFLLGASGFAFIRVAIQPNGRIVVGGRFVVNGDTQGLFAARFLGDPVRRR